MVNLTPHQQLLAITSEGARLAQILTDQLRSLPPDDNARSRFREGAEMARLRTACDQLETFLNRYSAELPTSLLLCLQLGGHLQPFLLLMEEATQIAPGGAGDAALYIALAETVDKKIVADLAFITRTMASAGSVEADKPGS